MEGVVKLSKSFWKGKKVLITGHTGFKGSWLTLMLSHLGAQVIGYSKNIPTSPSLFKNADVELNCRSYFEDILCFEKLFEIISVEKPELVFHLAAQSLVRKSYGDPINTFNTNVMGTVNVLEAIRHSDSVKVCINVTSDKCYENNELFKPFKEEDRLGGYDPYSSSKACAELVNSSYINSFFSKTEQRIASVRAGNVIGGGDWAEDRLIPDIIRSYVNSQALVIRNPHAVRPWQHVLDPLNGYVILAQNLWDNKKLIGAWNFGPINFENITVSNLVNKTTTILNTNLNIHGNDTNLYEANYLKLDSSKAIQKLNWKPKLSFSESIDWTIKWYKSWLEEKNMRDLTITQIINFYELCQ